ncbi:MAG: hypothetical protein ISP71_06990, partial [Flavobacteriales bacterium]|nr:hypothetical protein [Flavobacteriales bacterium]
MRKIVFILIIVSIAVISKAQVRLNNNLNEGSLNESSAFLDASSTPTWNFSANVAKGIVFPRTDLTIFTFTLGSTGPYGLANFTNRWDGFIVFNTGTGISAVGGDSIYPGFYYYRNTHPFNADAGHWIPMTNTDGQVLSVSNDTLYISNGNGVYLGPINDNDQDSTNEIQTLSFQNDSLFLTQGGAVDLSSLIFDFDTVYSQGDSLVIVLDNFQDTTFVDLGEAVGTDDQNINIDGDSLRIENGNAVALSDLGTDNQGLTYATLTDNVLTIDIERGDSVTVDLSALAFDFDTVYSQGDSLVMVLNDFQDTTFVNLGEAVGSDDQQLTFSNDTLYLEDGGEVDLSGLMGTDDQNINIDGDSLRIEDGNAVALSDLGTDDQQLTFSNDTLYLEDGGEVDLSGLMGTDDQNINIDGDSLRIEDGNAVSLSDLGTDDQQLTFSNDTLYLE